MITSGKRTLLLIGLLLTVSLLLSLCFSQPLLAAERPILYLFWGEGCPHCEDEKEFLSLIREEYPQLEMRWFEVWSHPEFAKLADAVRQAYGIKVTSVPMTFLGEWGQVGFRSFETTGAEIIEQIDACLEHGCKDALDTVALQQIVTKIRKEAMKNQPNGWEHYPALSSGNAAP